MGRVCKLCFCFFTANLMQWFYGSVDTGPCVMGELRLRPRFILYVWYECGGEWRNLLLLLLMLTCGYQGYVSRLCTYIERVISFVVVIEQYLECDDLWLE